MLNTVRKAMDNQENYYRSKPISDHENENGNGLFGFVFFIAATLITCVNPAFALPPKEAKCDLSSSQLIHAKAAIVVDTNGSVIYAKNQDVKLPPASTTKLITAMVALDKLDPEAKVRITSFASKTHSSQPRLRANEELTVSDLLHLALMKSVNSAAVALAEESAGSEEAFVELMNEKAITIGAVNTRFVNASGLPNPNNGMQYTTVYDLTLILSEALKYPIIKEIIGKKECVIVTPGGRSMRLRSTDKLLWAEDNIIGGKTGYTRNAQHCFVGAFQTDDGPIFTAVLGTKSRNRLWKSTELLYSLRSEPQNIQSTRLVNEDTSLVPGMSDKETGERRYKKNRKKRHLSKQRHEGRAIRLARK